MKNNLDESLGVSESEAVKRATRCIEMGKTVLGNVKVRATPLVICKLGITFFLKGYGGSDNSIMVDPPAWSSEINALCGMIAGTYGLQSQKEIILKTEELAGCRLNKLSSVKVREVMSMLANNHGD